MANDLVLTKRERAFATAGMLPVGEEELNYIWGRKLSENALAATPTPLGWGTIVMGTTGSAVFGSHALTFDTAIWPNIPWIELWQVRGGTEIVYADSAYRYPLTVSGERRLGLFVHFGILGAGDGTIYIDYYPDVLRTTDSVDIDFAGSQAQYGTWLYRLS